MANSNVIIFGGYILTGGTFTDKDTKKPVPWKGVSVLIAECSANSMPVKAEVVKGVYSDSFVEHLQHLAPGTIVQPEFALHFGQIRLVDIRPASSASTKIILQDTPRDSPRI